MPWAINPRSLVLKEMSSEGHYYSCYISYCNRKDLAWAFQEPIFPVLVSFQRFRCKGCSQLVCIYIHFQGVRVCPLLKKQKSFNWNVWEVAHLALCGLKSFGLHKRLTQVCAVSPRGMDNDWVKTQPLCWLLQHQGTDSGWVPGGQMGKLLHHVEPVVFVSWYLCFGLGFQGFGDGQKSALCKTAFLLLILSSLEGLPNSQIKKEIWEDLCLCCPSNCSEGQRPQSSRMIMLLKTEIKKPTVVRINLFPLLV